MIDQITSHRALRGLTASLLACALVFTGLLHSGGSASAAPMGQETAEPGVLVVSVLADSAAADAGLRRGDIILTVDGEEVNDAMALRAALDAKKAGDEIEVTYTHGDDEITATVTLGEADGRVLLGIVPYPSSDVVEIQTERRTMPGVDAPPMVRFFAMEEGGALIADVVEGSAAADAGLEAGEVIISVDDEAVVGGAALVETIAGYAPGDTVTLEVKSAEGETRTVEVTLGEREDDAEAAFLGVQITNAARFNFTAPEGMSPEGMPHFNFEIAPGQGMGMMLEGVLVGEVADDSPAADAGLQAGDLITEVDGEAITAFDDLRQIITDAAPGDELTLTVQSLGGMPPIFRNDGKNGAETDITTEAETRTLKVTLGENEDGQAYLGIAAAPFSWHIRSGTPLDHGRPQFYFRGDPSGSNGTMPHFYFHPGGERGRLEITPAPVQPVMPSTEL